MGTGILALALNQLPVSIPGLHQLARGLWLFDIVLFVLFSGLYVARWIFFFDGARRIFGHPVMSMFFGTIPMGLATIINGFLAFGPSVIGHAALPIAHSLWWVDVAMSLASGLIIPFLMLSYALWAFSVPLALSILVVLVLRLILHKLPHKYMAASGWLALGPIGTGALGLLLLGQDAPSVFAAVGMPSIGIVAQGIGVVGGMLLWGYGVWWLALAVMVTARYLRDGMPFNIGWWGFTFPLGVYAVATLTLARQTRLVILADFGVVLVGLLVLLWIIVFSCTALGAWRGDLFFSPCLMSNVAPIATEADIG